MVAPPPAISAKWTRALIQALSLAKQSLEGYDECQFDRKTCQNEVAGFEVDWLMMPENEKGNSYFPPVVPSFIHRETSISMLDSIIRNPGTIIALIDCTPESNMLVALGIEIFCISQSDRIPPFDSVGDLLDEKYLGYRPEDTGFDIDRFVPSRNLLNSMNLDTIDPKDVARQLLRVLRRKTVGPEKPNDREKDMDIEERKKKIASLATSGLERTLRIVEITARAYRENSLENLQDMQRVIFKAITDSLGSIDPIQQSIVFKQSNNIRDIGGKKELHDTFTIFISCIIFISASLYVLSKDSAVVKRWRTHRHHHRNRLLDGILSRLSDLDDAWEMLLVWWRPGKSTARNSGGENAADNTGNEQQLPHSNQLVNNHNHGHGHGHARRRRKAKMAR